MKNKIFLILAVALVSTVSCKKFDNPPPIFEELDETVSTHRKVLMISIDGLTGTELASIAPPAIEGLRKTSKYTFDVINGSVANDVASWASMMNGVSFNKHAIQNEDFIPNPATDSHSSKNTYITLFDYVLQNGSLRNAIVTPRENLRKYLRVADFAPMVATDVQVKDETIKILSSESAVGVVVANFRDVQAAGLSGGYLATNPNYKNAVIKADEYVGNIVSALKARKNYDKEEWLVLITTNHGGSNDDPKPGFLIASNSKLKQEELKKYGFNTLLFSGRTGVASVPDDGGLYDPGASKDFTVQMQFKLNSNANGGAILSKATPNNTGASTGWSLWVFNSTLYFQYGGADHGGTTAYSTVDAATFADFKWHTITMSVKSTSATSRTTKVFVDGVQKFSSTNITNAKSVSTSDPLRLGYNVAYNAGITGATYPVNFYAADLLYFNKAVDDAIITSNYALKDVKKHPDYPSVIGHWPIDEGGGAILYNRASTGFDMVVNGGFNWKPMNNNLPISITPAVGEIKKSFVVNSADVTAVSLYWLRISILPEYGLDGDPFLKNFELEFSKN